MRTIGTIGCGNMARAILKGVKTQFGNEVTCFGYDINPDQVERLSQEIEFIPCASVAELIAACDEVLLAVKPQNFPDLLPQIASADDNDKIYLCIAAGITADYIKRALGFDAKIVSIMPNTPLMVGVGATAMAQIPPVSDEEFARAKELFACAGIVCEVKPEQLNAVISLNGSSPAFLYEFARGFFRFGEAQGFSRETITALFCQSMRGAAAMIEQSGESIERLIEMVSSKGGTTIAGLSAFADHDLQGIIDECCERCTNRAAELAK